MLYKSVKIPKSIKGIFPLFSLTMYGMVKKIAKD